MSTTDPIQYAVYQYLRNVGVLIELQPPKSASPNIGKVFCSDERSSEHENQQTRNVSGLGVLPYGIFGGGMRFSPYCPETPDTLLGFKSSPNSAHVQIHAEKIRKGMRFRGNTLLKVSGHYGCGLAQSLGLGVWKHVMLVLDGRNYLRQRSIREGWLKAAIKAAESDEAEGRPKVTYHDAEFKIFAAYHVYRCDEPAERQHRTYLINKDHPLVLKYSMEEVMEMSDHDFLAQEQPVVLDRILNFQR